MHLYLRIIHEARPESYSQDEEQQLRESVASAPGVGTVKEIKRHSRGGYSVTIDGESSGIEQIISHLTAAGYRLVI